MDQRKNQTFEKLLLVVTLVLVFLMTARTPLDSDMWWALRAGKETWQQQAPYTIDTLSHTFTGQLWISHSWLFTPSMSLRSSTSPGWGRDLIATGLELRGIRYAAAWPGISACRKYGVSCISPAA